LANVKFRSHPTDASSGAGSCVFAETEYAEIGHVHGFYRGTDGNLWHGQSVFLVGPVWSNWGHYGTSLLNADPGATSFGYGALDVWGLDNSSNPRMLHYFSRDDGGSHGVNSWDTAPNGYQFVGNPDVASWGPNRVDVISTANQTGYAIDTLFHRSYDNGTLSSWQQWGGPGVWPLLFSSPAISSPRLTATQNSHQIDVVVLSGGNAYHNVSFDGSTLAYTNWENLGHSSVPFASNAEADIASWGDVSGSDASHLGRLDLVVNDQNGNIQQMTCRNVPTDPGDPQRGLCAGGTLNWWGAIAGPPGGITFGKPSIIQAGDFRSLWAATGSDGNVWTLWFDFSTQTWGNWQKGSYAPAGGPDFAGW
jgi:hypothetical protein